ncbi:MAG: hypothetical protein ABI579_00055, partial [Candidatus Sumerlaeota bacterium]
AFAVFFSAGFAIGVFVDFNVAAFRGFLSGVLPGFSETFACFAGGVFFAAAFLDPTGGGVFFPLSAFAAADVLVTGGAGFFFTSVHPPHYVCASVAQIVGL